MKTQPCHSLIVNISCSRQAGFIYLPEHTRRFAKRICATSGKRFRLDFVSSVMQQQQRHEIPVACSFAAKHLSGILLWRDTNSTFKKIKIKMKRVTPPITHLKLLSHWRIVRIDCRGDTADETHGSGERTRASAVLTRLLSGNQNLVGLMRFCSGCLFCQLCCRSFDREAKLP